MTPRLNPYKAAPEAMKALVALENYVQESGLDHSLIDLVKTRASQINGCAYCIHMHTSEARARGETEERLYLLDAWHESPLYSDRERAALAWTEAVTLVSETHVPDGVYDQARATFLGNRAGQSDDVHCCDQCLEPHCNRLPRGSSDTLEGRGLKSRSKTRGGCSAGTDRRIPMEGEPSEKVTRVRVGSYEFKKKGVSRFDLRDPYHLAVALTWPQFLAALLALYLSVNIVFAALFWLAPGSVANTRPGSLGDAFFFSIETLATVGYGEMYPATPYGRVVAATEIVCGLAFTAILTGLTFVRFSRPRAKLIFAANPVVATHNGKPTLMVRIGNGRAAVLADARAQLNVLRSETTSEGKLIHRGQELRLERAHIPFFPLFWTLMHVLDERSPLYGYDSARAIAAKAQVFVLLEARDPMLATTVHDIRNYGPEEIRFGMRYRDAVTTAEDGTPILDLTGIGELEPDVGDRQEQGWTEREEKRE